MSSTAEDTPCLSKSQKKKMKKKASAARQAESTASGAIPGALRREIPNGSGTDGSGSGTNGTRPASTGEILRLKGNRLLRSVGGFNPMLRLQRLHEVKDLYARALDKAAGAAEEAACHKNLAACHLYFARIEDEVHQRDEEACGASRKAVLAYTEAIIAGHSLPADWLQDVETRRARALEYGRNVAVLTGDHAVLLSYHSKLLSLVPEQWGRQKSQLAMMVAQDLFHAGVTCLEVEDARNAQRFFAAAHTPLTVAEQGGENAWDEEDCRELRASLHQHTCIASSAQVTANADRLVKFSLEDSEELPVDKLWQAADMYRSAMSLTRECDVFGEAKACSRLGMLFYLALGNKAKAMPLLRSCMQLAHVIVPVPMTTDWFKAARDTLQQEQRGVRKRDDQAWQEAKGPILHALKPELAACKRAADKGFKALIHHIFTEHPPRVIGPKPEIPECTPDTWKSALQTALRHYHPDRNHTDPDDTWFVLCEEMTKMLTVQYDKLSM